MNILNLRNLLFIVTLLMLFSSCTNHKDGKNNELYYPLDSLSSATAIDSVMSDDGNLKIYTMCLHTEENSRQYNTVIVYRTPDGRQHVDKRPVFDIANNTDYGCYLPIEHIFQTTSDENTLYIILLDNLESTLHDNSMLVALHITDDSIQPVPIFRHESNDTCLITPSSLHHDILPIP